jgi:hypothetical protein
MLELGLLDRKVPIMELKAKLSYRNFKGALDTASVLKNNVLSTNEGLEKAFADLRKTCKAKYPNNKFINIE